MNDNEKPQSLPDKVAGHLRIAQEGGWDDPGHPMHWMYKLYQVAYYLIWEGITRDQESDE